MDYYVHRFKGDVALCGEGEPPVYLTPHDAQVTCPDCNRMLHKS